MFPLSPLFQKALLRPLCAVFIACCVSTTCQAGAIGTLGPAIPDTPNKRISVDISLQFDSEIGNTFEAFFLDLVKTEVNGSPFSQFSLFQFQPVAAFSHWQSITGFADVDIMNPSGSMVFLGAINENSPNPPPDPLNSYPILDNNVFTFGRLTFDYSTLAAFSQVTFDVSGTFDAMSMSSSTTLVVVEPPVNPGDIQVPKFVDPKFNTVSFILGGPPNVVPEPTSLGCFFMLAMCLGTLRRR